MVENKLTTVATRHVRKRAHCGCLFGLDVADRDLDLQLQLVRFRSFSPRPRYCSIRCRAPSNFTIMSIQTQRLSYIV